jgi:hypothetical protein
LSVDSDNDSQGPCREGNTVGPAWTSPPAYLSSLPVRLVDSIDDTVRPNSANDAVYHESDEKIDVSPVGCQNNLEIVVPDAKASETLPTGSEESEEEGAGMHVTNPGEMTCADILYTFLTHLTQLDLQVASRSLKVSKCGTKARL